MDERNEQDYELNELATTVALRRLREYRAESEVLGDLIIALVNAHTHHPAEAPESRREIAACNKHLRAAIAALKPETLNEAEQIERARNEGY